jgi:hypothetical protein
MFKYHSINTGHQIDFNNTSVLNRASGYMDRLVKEAIQTSLNYENFNRDSGFTLSRAWNLVTKLLFKHDTDQAKRPPKPPTGPNRTKTFRVNGMGQV